MENHSLSSTELDLDSSTSTKKGLTRRQVAVGAAWAAPVVALAIGTPLAAASTVVPNDPTTYPRATPTSSGLLLIPSNPAVGVDFDLEFLAQKLTIGGKKVQTAYKKGMTVTVVTTQALTNVSVSDNLTPVGAVPPVAVNGVFTWTYSVNTADTELDFSATPTTTDQIVISLHDGGTQLGSATTVPRP